MRSFIFLLLVAILLTIIGCSSSGDKGPVQAPDNALRDYNIGNGHSVMGCGSMIIEPGSSEILTIPNRAMEIHYNVTYYLHNPKCPGSSCLKLYVWKYDSQKNEYYIDIYVLNPTPQNPPDPRFILLTSEYPDDFDVRNADSWVTLYDNDEYPDNRNPFIAMAKDEVNNRRLPQYPIWDSETLVLWINPDKPQTSVLSYIFDISWPTHCREPYEIGNIDFIEPYYKLWRNPPTYVDSCSIACDVFDWQDNAIEVSFYAPDIFGDEDWRALTKDTDPSFPNRWKADFEDIDTTDITEGWYETWFVALSGNPTDQVDRIYQRFDFPVFHYDESGTGGTGGKKPRIAFLRDKTGYADIYIKDLWLGGAEYLLIDTTTNPTWLETEEYRPAISPDGKWVAFASNHGGQIDLWRMKLDSSGIPAKITDTWADDCGPRFDPKSPDLAHPEIVCYS